MKKIISLLMAAIMVFSLCACNNSSTTDGEIPTLVWYITGDTQPDQQTVIDAINEKLVEKIGAKIDVKFISEGAYSQKMKMIMAAREEFDLCFTGYNNPYVDAVDNGALYDITELLEGSVLYEQLDQKCFDVATIDGRIYGIPNQQIFALPMCLVVRKDLAEKYNLDMSNFTKTTDIEPFLETIKQNEPDYIPFSAFHKLNSVQTINDKQYADYGTIQVEKVGENDWEAIKPDYSKETNVFYNKAKVMNDWYKKGYIRKDVDTVPDDTSDLGTGRYAVTIASYSPGCEESLKSQVNGDVVVKVIGPRSFNVTFPLATMISVSATTKYPEKCVEFIELINTDVEIYNMLCYGLEGKHYNKVSENRVELIKDSGYNPNAAWKFGNIFNSWLMGNQPEDTHEQTREINATADVLGIPGFVFDKDPVTMELTQIATVSDKYVGMQLGSVDPDTVWDEYVKDMLNAGKMKCYEEVSRQIEEFENSLTK